MVREIDQRHARIGSEPVMSKTTLRDATLRGCDGDKVNTQLCARRADAAISTIRDLLYEISYANRCAL
jgi:hypothetical protein